MITMVTKIAASNKSKRDVNKIQPSKRRKIQLRYDLERRKPCSQSGRYIFLLQMPFLLILLDDVITPCHAGIFPNIFMRNRWCNVVKNPFSTSLPNPTARRQTSTSDTFFPDTSSSSSSSSSRSRTLSISRHGGSSISKDSPSQIGSSSSTQNKTSLNKQLIELRRKMRLFLDDLVTGTVHQEGSRFLHHVLYWVTAADAVHSIIMNDYSSILGSNNLETSTAKHFVPSVYSRLFYFARLRPRLLYAIGALLRALQLCTPFRRILDPTAGVGAGINLCALLAGSRWVKPLVLGWATTRWLWTWLGARQVDKAYLPITLSIHEWEEKKKNAKKAASRSDNSSE